jgi:hypothetical protein
MAQRLQAKLHLEGLHFKELCSDEYTGDCSQLEVPSVLALGGCVSSDQIKCGKIHVEILYATNFATVKNPINQAHPHAFAELDRRLVWYFLDQCEEL